MKKTITTIMAVAFAMAINAQSLFVGTYNVRNQNDGDAKAGNGWTVRGKALCEQIDFEDPDVFGTQEALHGQVADLERMLDGYGSIGVGREDGKQAGEYSAVFYKKDRLRLLDSGNFWLSPTPEKPTIGWDAACIRICTWGQFEQKATGLKFYFFNLHMDHVGLKARSEAAKLVVKKIREIANGAPTVLTGDFNVDQHNDIFKTFTTSGILVDTYDKAQRRFIENGTFNDFDPNLKSDSRIDHIFVSPSFTVKRYGVLTDTYWSPSQRADSKDVKAKNAPEELRFKNYQRRCLSDHYPVFVKLEKKN